MIKYIKSLIIWHITNIKRASYDRKVRAYRKSTEMTHNIISVDLHGDVDQKIIRALLKQPSIKKNPRMYALVKQFKA